MKCPICNAEAAPFQIMREGMCKSCKRKQTENK